MSFLSDELIKKQYPQIPNDANLEAIIKQIDDFISERANIPIPDEPAESPTWAFTPAYFLAYKFYFDTLQVLDADTIAEARWKYSEACDLLDRKRKLKPILEFGTAEREREW